MSLHGRSPLDTTMQTRNTCFAVAVIALLPSLTAVTAQSLSSASPCRGSLNGAQYPELVPEYLAWQALFGELQREGIQHPTVNDVTLGATAYKAVVEKSNGLRSQLAALQRLHQGREVRIRDAEIADAVTDARDDLIRSLSSTSYAILKAALQKAKRKPFELPAPGQTVENTLAEGSCQVRVRGRDYPHLIRDRFVWKLYFQTVGGAAKSLRRGPSEFDPRHIRAVQSSLPIPLPHEYLVDLLETSSKVVTDIEQLPQTADADAAADAIAEAARDALIRRVPRTVWLAIKADTRRIRTGAVITFPPNR